MAELKYTIKINAPKQKVWEIMLADKTYREWTEAFQPGSYYKGEWKTGAKMLFLGDTEEGTYGMASKIAEARPYEYVSIEHMGEVVNSEEIYDSESAKAWAGAQENYTFIEEDGATTLVVELKGLEIPKEYMDMFEESWPRALDKLKEIVESAR